MSKYDFLTKDILQQDYDELGTLSAIARKYDMPIGSLKARCRRLKIKTDKPGGKCKYTVNESIFSEDSEAGFYIAGFAAADGNITHDERSDTSVFRIGLSRKDRSHLDSIRSLLQFTGPLRDHEFLNENRGMTLCSSMNIYCSKKLISDLGANFNVVPRKTFTYEFPKRVIGHELMHHFIRGYNDGDGCFTNTSGRISFELLGTEPFLRVIESILKDRCQLSSKATTYPYRNIARLRFSGDNSVSKIASFLYKDATIYLKRKHDIVKHLL